MSTNLKTVPGGNALSRRSLLGALAALPAAAALPAVAAPQSLLDDAQDELAAAFERIRRETRSIAEIMKNIHGGDWRVAIDQDNQFVLIARDFPSSAEARS